jgi:hypothetical protein
MSMVRDIDSICARLAELEAERAVLNEQLEQLRGQRAQVLVCGSVSTTTNSTAMEKISLFRRLFAGRSEVFPVRWENRNTGKSGYAPACANEWVRGVCGKPQVTCGECPNQAFITLSDNVIASHLRGAKVSALQNYKLDGFSVERLMTFLTGLGSDIEIRIHKPKRASNRAGRISVESASSIRKRRFDGHRIAIDRT